MEIQFSTTKLKKACNDVKERNRTYGPERSKRIGMRLDQMLHAENLAEFILIHPRCHLLKGDLKGIWSADLDHPYRLLFEPVDEPLPVADDGGLITAQVKTIKVLGIEDTH